MRAQPSPGMDRKAVPFCPPNANKAFSRSNVNDRFPPCKPPLRALSEYSEASSKIGNQLRPEGGDVLIREGKGDVEVIGKRGKGMGCGIGLRNGNYRLISPRMRIPAKPGWHSG